MKQSTWVIALILAGSFAALGTTLILWAATHPNTDSMFGQVIFGMLFMVVAAVFGAIGSVTYLPPYERAHYRAQRAVRRSERRK